MQSAEWQSPSKSDANSRLSQGVKGLLAAKGVPLDELADDVDGARGLIRSGEARLEVVMSPWGLEFNLVTARKAEPAQRSS